MSAFYEPMISNAVEMQAALDTVKDQSFEAIVWVGNCNRHKPNGVLIESVFFMSFNSQGFSGMLEKHPNAPVYWFPWGQPYQFYIRKPHDDQEQQREMYLP